MSFFSEIAGLKGENLSSAILAHLMLRSPDVRSHVIDKISNVAPSGPVYVANQFAVFLEQSSKVEEMDARAGRIDIVIETDDAVIGIENKFNAPFQEGQPAGYFRVLQKRASQLEALRGNKFSPVLIVLGPARRRSEIKKYLNGSNQEEIAFLSWKKLLDGMHELEGMSSIDQFLVRELHAYVDNQIGNFRDLGKLLPHLRKGWSPRGTPAQHKFLNNFIWGLLDEGVKDSDYYQSSAGNEFYGWYLQPNVDASRHQVWIGFIKFEKDHNSAAFTIATNPHGLFERLDNGLNWEEFRPESGWSNRWQLFKIDFDTSDVWKTPEKWVEVLEPLNRLIKKIRAESTSDDQSTELLE